jgi:hypothetical protein
MWHTKKEDIKKSLRVRIKTRLYVSFTIRIMIHYSMR